jgi:hypothetical protein
VGLRLVLLLVACSSSWCCCCVEGLEGFELSFVVLVAVGSGAFRFDGIDDVVIFDDCAFLRWDCYPC